ncbi:hypothetical protein KCU95_g5, partial [Aureobasidium melanogenum]
LQGSAWSEDRCNNDTTIRMVAKTQRLGTAVRSSLQSIRHYWSASPGEVLHSARVHAGIQSSQEVHLASTLSTKTIVAFAFASIHERSGSRFERDPTTTRTNTVDETLIRSVAFWFRVSNRC